MIYMFEADFEEPVPRWHCITLRESARLVFTWQASIYKLLWKDVLVYIIAFISLTILYEYGLDEGGRLQFEAVTRYCNNYTKTMPVILLLGFFTSTTMQRWFMTQTSVPGTSRAICVFSMSLKENTPDAERLVEKHTRWLLLSWALTFRLVSKPLLAKYPDLIALQNAGFLLPYERILLENECANRPQLMPLIVVDWLLALVKRVQHQSCYVNAPDYARNIEAILSFKKSCSNTIKFANKNIPLALIQAVTIAVYAYGVASLMARPEPVKKSPGQIDTANILLTEYIPILQIIQYFLYYAWLKFGHAATDPFGYDENDIDVCLLFRKHCEDAVRLRSLFAEKGDRFFVEPDHIDDVKDCNEEHADGSEEGFTVETGF